MWRSLTESKSGSYAGRIAPPGMPKTFSTPAHSSERMRLCAPVIGSAVVLTEATADTWVAGEPEGGGAGVGALCSLMTGLSCRSSRSGGAEPRAGGWSTVLVQQKTL